MRGYRFARHAGRGRLRAAIAIATGCFVAAITVMTAGGFSSADAADTNGEPVLFPQVGCRTIIPVNIDITAHAVVPNNVSQGETYTATIPGGTTELPSSSNGLDVVQYLNLAQSYLFSASSGTATVTDVSAPPGSTVVNDQAFRNAVWSPAAPFVITALTYNRDVPNNGRVNFTTSLPHGLVAGDHFTSRGNLNTGTQGSADFFNSADWVVAAAPAPTATTFSVVNVGSLPVPGAGETAPTAARKGVISRLSGTSALTYISAGPHGLNPGDPVKTQLFEPASFNLDTTTPTVLDPSSFAFMGVPDPGLMTKPGYLDLGRTVTGAAQVSGRKLATTAAIFTANTPIAVSSIAYASATFTVTTSTPHGFAVGDEVVGLLNGPAAYNFTARPVATVPNATTFTVAGPASAPAALGTKGIVTKTAAGSGALVFRTVINHGLSAGSTISTTGLAPAGYNVTDATVSANALSPDMFSIPAAANPGAVTAQGQVLPNETNVATTGTPQARPGLLHRPDITITIQAPNADAVVTTYLMQITTTADVTALAAAVTCDVPHTDPQTDGISATQVGSGGATTVPKPVCDDPPQSPSCVVSTSAPSTTTTTEPPTTSTEEPTTTTEEPTTTTSEPETSTTIVVEETTTTTDAPTTTTEGPTTTTTDAATTTTVAPTTTTAAPTTTTAAPTTTTVAPTTTTVAPTTTTTAAPTTTTTNAPTTTVTSASTTTIPGTSTSVPGSTTTTAPDTSSTTVAVTGTTVAGTGTTVPSSGGAATTTAPSGSVSTTSTLPRTGGPSTLLVLFGFAVTAAGAVLAIRRRAVRS